MKIFPYSITVLFLSIFVIPFVEASDMRGMPNDLTEQAHKEGLLSMVSGIVQDVEGDWCVVQDSQGTEWKIQVDKYTDTIGRVLPGVTIIAMVEGNGHAKEVKVLQNE